MSMNLCDRIAAHVAAGSGREGAVAHEVGGQEETPSVPYIGLGWSIASIIVHNVKAKADKVETASASAITTPGAKTTFTDAERRVFFNAIAAGRMTAF